MSVQNWASSVVGEAAADVQCHRIGQRPFDVGKYRTAASFHVLAVLVRVVARNGQEADEGRCTVPAGDDAVVYDKVVIVVVDTGRPVDRITEAAGDAEFLAERCRGVLVETIEVVEGRCCRDLRTG